MTRLTGIALLHCAALAFGTFHAYRPTLESRFAQTQVEPGDGLLNHYLLEHSWRIVSDPNSPGTLISPPFFFPTRYVLWYSETLLGAAPVYWALRFVLPPDLAFQWWQIVSSALNYLAFAWVCRRLCCTHWLAAFGGFLWAFALIHTYQAMHQQLIPRFWMPIAVYHGWRLATEPTLRSWNRMLAAAFLQCVTCVYTGWFLVVGLAVFVPAAVWGRSHGGRELFGFIRSQCGPMGRISGLWGLAFAAYFLPYVLVNAGHARNYADSVGSLPNAASWISGPPGSRWHETLRPVLPERVGSGPLFSGFGVMVLAVTATVTVLAIRRERPAELALAAACLVAAATWVLLTLNVSDRGSAWSVVRFLPGGQAIRRVDRVASIVYLFGTLAGVMWLKWALDRLPRASLRHVMTLLIIVPIITEQTGYVPPAFTKANFYPVAERYAASLRGVDAAYVIPRPPQPHLPYQLYGNVLGMWAGMYAGVPVVNGYSGRYPDGYDLYEGDADGELRVWLGGRFRGRVAILDPERPEDVRIVVIE